MGEDDLKIAKLRAYMQRQIAAAMKVDESILGSVDELYTARHRMPPQMRRDFERVQEGPDPKAPAGAILHPDTVNRIEAHTGSMAPYDSPEVYGRRYQGHPIVITRVAPEKPVLAPLYVWRTQYTSFDDTDDWARCALWWLGEGKDE